MMSFLKRFWFPALIVLLIYGPQAASAAAPDFNADRRVNLKCPVTIDKDRIGQFETDGFKQTIRRLYRELDDNLSGSAKTDGSGFAFSSNPNKGSFFISHAKADFPAGALPSLSPADHIYFQEVFYLTDINWDKHEVQLVRQQGRKTYTLGINDFEKGFLWYNALIDKEKAYIPVYGFLSLPGDASRFPTLWNSWQEGKRDTATPPESLIDYDFYKILDYQDGYYLLGEDIDELDYRGNREDFGIIGWVEKKYITLWRSRLYFHPLKRVPFYNDATTDVVAPESEEINRFYVDHTYLNERLFQDIVEKIDQDSLHRFYTHFGFPQLGNPEYQKDISRTRVFIPGAFTPRLMRLLARSLKKNLNTFFLMDVSESMRPFADYLVSFNNAVRDMKPEGVGLRVNRTFAYWDTQETDTNDQTEPKFVRVRRPADIQFAKGTGDRNYAEPLMRAMLKVIAEIESLQNDKTILPLHEKMLFVITDAGPNDLTPERIETAIRKARELNLSIFFVTPASSGVRRASPSLEDTPAGAYEALNSFISLFETGAGLGTPADVRRFTFQTAALKSKAERQKYFSDQQRQLLTDITEYIDYIFKGAKDTTISRDVVLFFSDDQLLSEMRKWSDRKIQVLNHVTKYIDQFQDRTIWEERIAIPAKPIEAYLRAVRTQDDVSLSDLKKLVIINSLVSVDDIAKARRLYDHIKPLIERKMFKTADTVFYEALTNKVPGTNIQWNSALGERKGPLTRFLAERGFHLNSFNQAIQRKFMYLKVEDLYATD